MRKNRHKKFVFAFTRLSELNSANISRIPSKRPLQFLSTKILTQTLFLLEVIKFFRKVAHSLTKVSQELELSTGLHIKVPYGLSSYLWHSKLIGQIQRRRNLQSKIDVVKLQKVKLNSETK